MQEADFDPALELAALQAGRTDVGALVTFTGCVRGSDTSASASASAPAQEPVRAPAQEPASPITREPASALTLEHYPGMTERSIESMIDEAAQRFAILDARVIHRVGRLLPGDRIVWVGVAATHRRSAFEACEFLMDYLKTQAPFWKKETGREGERWVDAIAKDDEALARWGISGTNAGSLARKATSR
ncbi:MAG TPA: molybdenum cofactor biosynthesis protein MoaE [Burkholderiaceae bacterium]|nr:molybdenum cofactor biosynthesis protein MoaE [Burkholderiaceae bacterium]